EEEKERWRVKIGGREDDGVGGRLREGMVKMEGEEKEGEAAFALAGMLGLQWPSCQATHALALKSACAGWGNITITQVLHRASWAFSAFCVNLRRIALHADFLTGYVVSHPASCIVHRIVFGRFYQLACDVIEHPNIKLIFITYLEPTFCNCMIV
ncbi:MAG: hypothetical protein ACI382_05740, partial [Alloprevotella sp.]